MSLMNPRIPNYHLILKNHLIQKYHWFLMNLMYPKNLKNQMNLNFH
jgi:hypothetical protein